MLLVALTRGFPFGFRLPGNGVVGGTYNAACPTGTGQPAAGTAESCMFWNDLRLAGFVSGSGTQQPFNAFTGHGSRYVDDVRSWQSSEPALDMTGSAIIAAALQQSLAARGAS